MTKDPSSKRFKTHHRSGNDTRAPFIDRGTLGKRQAGQRTKITGIIQSVERMAEMMDMSMSSDKRPNLEIRYCDIDDFSGYHMLEMACMIALQWTTAALLHFMLSTLRELMEGEVIVDGKLCMTVESTDKALSVLHEKLLRHLKRFRNVIGIGILNIQEDTSLQLHPNGDLVNPPALLLLPGEDPTHMFPHFLCLPRQVQLDVAKQSKSIFGPLLTEVGKHISKIRKIFYAVQTEIGSKKVSLAEGDVIPCDAIGKEFWELPQKFNLLSFETNQATHPEKMNRFGSLRLHQSLTWPLPSIRYQVQAIFNNTGEFQDCCIGAWM